jgi:hypothetical protein
MTPGRRSSPLPRRTLAWLLVLAVLLQGTWGCAMFRPPDPPASEKIAIRAEVERDEKGQLAGDLEAYSTLKGVLVGTVTGLPSGGLTGGTIAFGAGFLACGTTAFLWPLCVFAATVTGAVIGAVVGLLGGGVMGFIGGLPSDTAKQVTAAIAGMEEGRSFDEHLLTAVKQAVPQEKQADAAEAAILLTARLNAFDLRQHSSDRLSVRLQASMVQTWEGKGGKRRKNTCKYRYDSERKEAEAWLAEGGSVSFGEAVMQGLDTLARWMNRDLEAFAAKTELPETADGPASCFREPRWYRLY